MKKQILMFLDGETSKNYTSTNFLWMRVFHPNFIHPTSISKKLTCKYVKHSAVLNSIIKDGCLPQFTDIYASFEGL